MNKTKLTKVGLAVALFSLLVLPAVASADVNFWTYATETELGTKDVRATVFAVINVILGFLGVVAVVIILIGGFKWMTAGGNEEKVTEARKLIIAGIIGLAIVFASYAIAQFVVNQLYEATGGNAT